MSMANSSKYANLVTEVPTLECTLQNEMLMQNFRSLIIDGVNCKLTR